MASTVPSVRQAEVGEIARLSATLADAMAADPSYRG
jgi:hypothetical protein